MFLKSLIIYVNGDIRREINFRKGVNLIVDETISANKTGNNVGKTTVLRLIDFCLGGEGKNIYTDTEFKNKTNTNIESFLINNNVLIELTLVKDLDNYNNSIVIKKNFLKRSEKILKINGKKVKIKDFSKILMQKIFHTSVERPTFRQIVSKNIRDEKNKLTNTIKVLNQFVSKDEYEALYLFWLGVSTDTLKEKQELILSQKTIKKIIDNISKNGNLSQINQSLKIINSNISNLEEQQKHFDINAHYDSDIKKLDSIKSKLNKLHSEYTRLVTKKELIVESKNDLENSKSNIENNSVLELYKKAKSLIPNIQKTFEETICFHNQMIDNKVKYISKELPEVLRSIESISLEIKLLSTKEEKLSNQLYKNDTIKTLSEITFKLNKEYEEKGVWTERKESLTKYESELEKINKRLIKINQEINSKDSLIQDRITIFNKYFSSISHKLYNESFILSSSNEKNNYELNISSLSGNLGTGKKKGQIAAFDLAYIQFAQELNISHLHFILHDQIETVHGNQILKLITEVVADIDCQYIVPILKDKLPSDLDINPYTILTLSEDDKLFKL